MIEVRSYLSTKLANIALPQVADDLEGAVISH